MHCLMQQRILYGYYFNVIRHRERASVLRQWNLSPFKTDIHIDNVHEFQYVRNTQSVSANTHCIDVWTLYVVLKHRNSRCVATNIVLIPYNRHTFIITRFWQMIFVVHFAISSRNTLDVDWAFVSTMVSNIISSAGFPFDLNTTAIWRVVIFNWRHTSLCSIATFSQQQNNDNYSVTEKVAIAILLAIFFSDGKCISTFCIVCTTYTVSRKKKTEMVVCYICYNSWAILMKFVTQFPE